MEKKITKGIEFFLDFLVSILAVLLYQYFESAISDTVPERSLLEWGLTLFIIAIGAVFLRFIFGFLVEGKWLRKLYSPMANYEGNWLEVQRVSRISVYCICNIRFDRILRQYCFSGIQIADDKHDDVFFYSDRIFPDGSINGFSFESCGMHDTGQRVHSWGFISFKSLLNDKVFKYAKGLFIDVGIRMPDSLHTFYLERIDKNFFDEYETDLESKAKTRIIKGKKEISRSDCVEIINAYKGSMMHDECISVSDDYISTACGLDISNISSSDSGLAVMIDTDPGTDDAMALLLASWLMKERLIGLMAANGNVSEREASVNLRLIVGVLDLPIHLFHGIEEPITGNKIAPTFYHGEDGLGGARNLARKVDASIIPIEPFDCGKAILDGFSSFDYIAIGPLTNLATMLTDSPIASHIRKVLIMGGGLNVHNVGDSTEFNFFCDPEAARMVLSSGLEIVLFPLDLTMQYPLSEYDIEDIVSGCDLPFFEKILRANFDAGRAHGYGAYLHDVFPILYEYDEDLFETEELSISIDCYGVISQSGNDGEQIEITCVKSLRNKEILVDFLHGAFSKFSRNCKLDGSVMEASV